MLIPINSSQISKLIPAVGTGSQFKYALGNPRKILQRVIVSSIGGFISLIISSTGDQTNNCLLYTSPSPRDSMTSRMPSSA